MAMKYKNPKGVTEHRRGCQPPAPAQTITAHCNPEGVTEHRMGNYMILFFALCLLCCPLSTLAQQPADVTKNINAIKRDKQYLHAEATMKDQGSAYNGAMAILEVIVSDWIHEQYPDEDIELCIVKAKDHCQQLQTLRGNFYRAFVYVRKSDILPVNDQNEVTVFQVEPQNGQTEEAPPPPAVQTPAPPAVTLSEEEQRMTGLHEFDEIEPYVKRLKATDKVTNYGKYTTMPTTGLCHLFIYNQTGEVVAVLRKEDTTIINLRTRQQDEITNYKNCGAIWLQLKPAQ